MSSEVRVAVIGAAGQLGSELVRALAGWQVIALTHAEMEVTDPARVRAALDAAAPDIVINTAAFHRVDECEVRIEQCFRTNALGAGHVAQEAARRGAGAVYVSTDYVFDGEAGRPYVETDAPRPLNVYGASKLAGEVLTAAATSRHLIVRVAGLFGGAGVSAKGANFVETMLRKAAAAEPIQVVDDLTLSPTYAADAAALVRRCLEAGETGVIHAANAGACTWYEFACEIFAITGRDVSVRRARSPDVGGPARRPRFAALASSRAQRLGVEVPPWRDGLRRYLAARRHAGVPSK